MKKYYLSVAKSNMFSPELVNRSAYINMIRDPIARFESFYYFSRFGNELGGGGKAKLTEERKNESIDQCVQESVDLHPYKELIFIVTISRCTSTG